MRNAVYTLLQEDEVLATLGVESIHSGPGADSISDKCFLILRWSDRNREFGMVGTQDLSVWVHSHDSDYRKINQILARIKFLMASTLHREGTDGVLRQSTWQGDSPDFRDDGYKTYTRYSSFRCNGDSDG